MYVTSRNRDLLIFHCNFAFTPRVAWSLETYSPWMVSLHIPCTPSSLRLLRINIRWCELTKNCLVNIMRLANINVVTTVCAFIHGVHSWGIQFNHLTLHLILISILSCCIIMSHWSSSPSSPSFSHTIFSHSIYPHHRILLLHRWTFIEVNIIPHITITHLSPLPSPLPSLQMNSYWKQQRNSSPLSSPLTTLLSPL